jgi:hypothetical protein
VPPSTEGPHGLLNCPAGEIDQLGPALPKSKELLIGVVLYPEPLAVKMTFPPPQGTVNVLALIVTLHCEYAVIEENKRNEQQI